MHSGNTYVLGTPDEWVLLTLPDGLTLQFTGLSEGQRAHFTEPTTGAEIILDWTTGTEIRRNVPASRERRSTSRIPRFAEQTTTPTTTLLRQLATSKPPGLTYGADTIEWRPYPDLPDNTQVAVHPNMLNGKSIPVCTLQSQSGFPDDIKAGINAWNTAVEDYNASINNRPSSRSAGFARSVFTWADDCPTDSPHINLMIVADSTIVNKCQYTGVGKIHACAHTIVNGTNPPQITGSVIEIKRTSSVLGTTDNALREWVIIHELGHFVGLGDYYSINNHKCDSGDSNRQGYLTTMANRLSKCHMNVVQDRDLKDLHAVYHPRARWGMNFTSSGLASWMFYSGHPPADTANPPHHVDNAYSHAIFRRAADSDDSWQYKGMFNGDGINLRPFTDPFSNDGLLLTSSVDQIAGQEFAVFGTTGGDIRGTSRQAIEEHGIYRFRPGGKDWTLGTPRIVYGPPSKPLNLSATVEGQTVVLSWSSVPGATGYYVRIYRFGATRSFRTVPVDADPGSCSVRATISGLASRVTHVFRVEAERAGVPMRSELSEQVTASLTSGRNPRGAAGSVPASGESVGGSGSCTVPVEVRPVVGESASCPVDAYSWALRAVGGGFVCERLDSAASVPGTTVVGCPRVVPEYAVVPVGGVEKCRRTLVAAPTETLGDPECGEGFLPVRGGASCSRTDSLPATATRGCPDGYTLVGLGVPLCSDSVPASATTSYECGSGYRLVGSGSPACVSSVAATESVRYSCRAPYSLVNLDTPFCYDSVPATATTSYECRSGYRLVTRLLGGTITRECRRTVAATETVTYSCEPGYTLVNFGTRSCYRSVPAKATTSYECRSGYRLVSRLVGGSITRVCQRTVAATASYSCDRGYTRSGRSCSKYIYTSLTNGACPAGYTVFFNGFAHLCRKKVTVDATVTYSCAGGYSLSGSTCTRSVAPTSRVTYSCASGYSLSGRTCTRSVAPTSRVTYSCASGYTLSGTNCTRSVAPTSRVTHDCDDAPAGYTLSGSSCTDTIAPIARPSYHCNKAPPGHTLSGTNCVHRVAPTSRVVYDCDDAPAGYTLSGANCTDTTAPTTSYDCDTAPPGYTLSNQDCVKITTRAPTRPTIYTCPATYTRIQPADTTGKPTCEKIDIINATVTTTPRGCPAVRPTEPLYELQEDHVAGTTKHTCERTITTTAIIEPTYECPTGYTLTTTTDNKGTRRTCRLN